MAKTPARKPAEATASPATAPSPAPAAAAQKTAKPRAATKPKTPAAAKEPAARVKPVTEKPAKPKKPKLVRDSFTMPKTEYAAIDALKARAGKLGQAPKKSELLRAGIMALTGLDDAGLAAALAKVPAIKTGRPKQA